MQTSMRCLKTDAASRSWAEDCFMPLAFVHLSSSVNARGWWWWFSFLPIRCSWSCSRCSVGRASQKKTWLIRGRAWACPLAYRLKRSHPSGSRKRLHCLAHCSAAPRTCSHLTRTVALPLPVRGAWQCVQGRRCGWKGTPASFLAARSRCRRSAGRGTRTAKDTYRPGRPTRS